MPHQGLVETEPAALGPLLEHIYAAVEDPKRWKRFLRQLTTALPGTAASLLVRPRDEEHAPIVVHDGYPPGSIQSFIDRYAADCPFNDLERDAPTGQVYATLELLPVERYQDTPFYREWAVPNGLGAGFAVKLFDDARHYGSLVVDCSPETARRHHHRIAALLQTLTPHVQRAVVLGEELRAARHGALSDIIGLRSHALFVINDSRQILAANAAAREALKAGRVLRREGRDRLTLVDPKLAERLDQSLAGRDEPTPDQSSLVRQLLPTQTEADGIVILEVIRLKSRARVDTASPFRANVSGSFVLSLRTQAALRPPDEVDLVAALGLSPLEASTVAGLIAGLTAEQQAKARGVTADAVKWHLRRLYERFGCQSQSELVRIVVSLLRV